MKDLFSKVRVLFEGNNGGTGPEEGSPDVSVLSISRSGPDKELLHQALAGTHWRIVTARDCHEGLRILLTRRIPVVLYDRDLPGLPWCQNLKLLSSLSPACVILVSRVSDSYLWDEVIQQGGFDVLAKPFRREELIRTLNFALKHWRAGWIRGNCDRLGVTE